MSWGDSDIAFGHDNFSPSHHYKVDRRDGLDRLRNERQSGSFLEDRDTDYRSNSRWSADRFALTRIRNLTRRTPGTTHPTLHAGSILRGWGRFHAGRLSSVISTEPCARVPAHPQHSRCINGGADPRR